MFRSLVFPAIGRSALCGVYMEKLSVTSSPHAVGGDTTRGIMLDVIIALIPALAVGTYLFGFRALLLTAVSVVCAVAAEHIWCLIIKRPTTVSDLSAVVTGLLLGLNLPVTLPVWMAALGSVIAIIVVKEFFGGLGQNFVNPAIAARIILMVSFPAAMTKWVDPLAWMNSVDIVSSATPLSGGTAGSIVDMLIGYRGGCIGETCSAMLLLGGIYLVVRRVISPVIPLSFIGTVAVVSLIAGLDPLVSVMSGGLLLGAIFMATDYVTSPINGTGRLIFGIGCGLITMAIRIFGNLPEGVSFAILIMNILTPHINTLTLKKPFGWEAPQK